MRRVLIPLLALLFLSVRPAACAAEPPAGEACARALVAALAAGTDEAFTAFESAWRSPAAAAKRPLADRLAGWHRLHDQIGTLTVEVLSGDAGGGHVAGHGSNGPDVTFELMFEGTPPRLAGVRVALGNGGGPPGADDVPLDAATRDAALTELATLLEQRYVDPALGAKLAAMVRAGIAAGRWSGVDRTGMFAGQLTEALRAVVADGHLLVRPAAADDNGPKGSAPGAVPGDHGFIEAKLLDGGVGYMRLDMFDDGPEALAVAAREMKKLAGAKAVIFDLRHNGGGSPDMIEYLTGYLFEKPTLLETMVDRDGKTDREVRSAATIAGARFAPKTPVYVLTSRQTYSAAEEFAYDLKTTGRGIVVGETTGGGAHPVNGFKIAPRLKAMIPLMRVINPVTHGDWEGTGVAPDVPVAADKALDEALAQVNARFASTR